MSRAMGVDDHTLSELACWRDSDAFSPLDRLVLELAECMSQTPADVPDRLRAALLKELSEAQLAELASAIAWENHRARLNRSLGVREVGFSDGAFCVVPSHGR